MKNNRKKVIEINGKTILNEKELSMISGGTSRKTDDYTMANVANYYLNLLPFVNKDHIQITESSSGWQDVPGNPDVKKSVINREAVRSDMKWKNLSNKEKLYVVAPAAGVAFVAAGVLVPAALRYVKKRLGA